MAEPQDPFETTVFELEGAPALYMYRLGFPEGTPQPNRGDQAFKQFLAANFPNHLVFEAGSVLYLATTLSIPFATTLPYLAGLSKVNCQVTQEQKTRKLWRLFVGRLLALNDTVVRVAKSLYLLPFESFYFVTAKSNIKQRIFCYFDYEVYMVGDRVMVSTDVQMFIQRKPNALDALRDNAILKRDRNQMLVLNLNYVEKHFRFDCMALAQDSQSAAFGARYGATQPSGVQVPLITAVNLLHKQRLTLPADNFDLLERIKIRSFEVEQLYFCLKLVQSLNSGPFLRGAALQLSNISVKPNMELPPTGYLYEIYPVEGQAHLGSWCFFCTKGSLEVGTQLVEELMDHMATVFKQPLVSPRCFFIEQKADAPLYDSFKRGFDNKLTGGEQFVAVMAPTGYGAADFEATNEYLSQRTRSHLVVPVDFAKYGPGYLKSKLDKALRMYANTFIRPREDITKRVFVCHFVGLDSPAGTPLTQHLSVFTVAFEYETIKTFRVNKCESPEETSAFLDRLIRTSLTKTYFLVYGNKAGKAWAAQAHAAMKAVEDISIALFRTAKMAVFPNLRFNQSYAGQRVSFQSMDQAITPERHFTTNQLVNCYEHQFLSCVLGQSFFLVNFRKAYELNFVQNVDIDYLNRVLQFFFNTTGDPFIVISKLSKLAAKWKGDAHGPNRS